MQQLLPIVYIHTIPLQIYVEIIIAWEHPPYLVQLLSPISLIKVKCQLSLESWIKLHHFCHSIFQNQQRLSLLWLVFHWSVSYVVIYICISWNHAQCAIWLSRSCIFAGSTSFLFLILFSKLVFCPPPQPHSHYLSSYNHRNICYQVWLNYIDKYFFWLFLYLWLRITWSRWPMIIKGIHDIFLEDSYGGNDTLCLKRFITLGAMWVLYEDILKFLFDGIEKTLWLKNITFELGTANCIAGYVLHDIEFWGFYFDNSIFVISALCCFLMSILQRKGAILSYTTILERRNSANR